MHSHQALFLLGRRQLLATLLFYLPIVPFSILSFLLLLTVHWLQRGAPTCPLRHRGLAGLLRLVIPHHRLYLY
jgi:hypothetical protein